MIECCPDAIPAQPGAYALEFDIEHELEMCVGRLGTVCCGPGRVRYYGSARGPGGLRARVSRHLEPKGRRDHWHVDAFTRALDVTRVWIDLERSECDLVARDLASGRWQTAVVGFGSSDCHTCRSHLLLCLDSDTSL